MSDGVNRVTLVGNLGNDPELRMTGGGRSVCNFRMATNTAHGWGEHRYDRTEWHQVVIWDRLAELCAEHVHHGSKVYLEGHLETKSWEDRVGVTRRKTEIVANKVLFLDKGKTNANERNHE